MGAIANEEEKWFPFGRKKLNNAFTLRSLKVPSRKYDTYNTSVLFDNRK